MKELIYCKDEILECGRVTDALKSKYFPGKSFKEIRDNLEKMGLDRHMILELSSTEIALLTPFGVLMQIRPYDNNQLGMWGGVLEDGEYPEDGAIRELKEETGIEIDKSQLELVELNEHYHQYDNGDQVWYKTFRFCVKFDYVPKIVTDEESAGAVMVAHIILEHQRDFIKRMLEKIEQSEKDKHSL